MARGKKEELHEYADPRAEWRTKARRQIRATTQDTGQRELRKIKKQLGENYERDFLEKAEQAIKSGTAEQRIILRREYGEHDPAYNGKNLDKIVEILKKRYQI